MPYSSAMLLNIAKSEKTENGESLADIVKSLMGEVEFYESTSLEKLVCFNDKKCFISRKTGMFQYIS